MAISANEMWLINRLLLKMLIAAGMLNSALPALSNKKQTAFTGRVYCHSSAKNAFWQVLERVFTFLELDS